MKSSALLTAAVAAAATLATASAFGAAVGPQQHYDRSMAWQVKNLRYGIISHRTATWHYQAEIGVHRTPARYAERRSESIAFLRWIDHLWLRRMIAAKHQLVAHRLPLTGDWMTAVQIVQRDWPGTAAWMLSCSAHEGGHGIWVWNGGAPYSAGGAPTKYSNGYRTPAYGSSGAGGWMQFMEGTWSGQFYRALATARQEHLAIPLRQDWSWTSPIGQAFAAGYGYSNARYAWTGDPYC